MFFIAKKSIFLVFKYLFMAKIVNLSEASSIALHAMILIGRAKGGSINVDQIAEVINSSRHHVAKVMQRLVKEGFVNSYRGPHGGFFLVRKPEQINLLEIYEAIEGKVSPSACPMDKPVCNFGMCFMDNIARELTVQFTDYLKSQTLAKYL